MTTRSLCLVALLACSSLFGCGGGSSKGGTGGVGDGTGGTSGGATGGTNGSTFVAIAPCDTEAAYETGATITFPNSDSSYSPKCLKVDLNAMVTFMPMAGSNFATYPLAPSAMRGNVADNPIQMVESTTAKERTFSFGVPGYYGYFCGTAGADADGSGMAGVIWVH